MNRSSMRWEVGLMLSWLKAMFQRLSPNSRAKEQHHCLLRYLKPSSGGLQVGGHTDCSGASNDIMWLNSTQSSSQLFMCFLFFFCFTRVCLTQHDSMDPTTSALHVPVLESDIANARSYSRCAFSEAWSETVCSLCSRRDTCQQVHSPRY